MSLVSALINEFKKQVNTTHIEVDWDAGDCYSYIKHPIMEVLHGSTLSQEEQDEFEDFTNNWLYENRPCLYDMCDVEGDKLLNHHDTLTGTEAKEYAAGLIQLIQQYCPNYLPYKAKVKELQEFINRS